MALTSKTVKLSSLTPYYKNPRHGDVGVIAESLEKLGQYRSIVVNEGSKTGRPMEILAGNHTWQAAGFLGWETMDIDLVDVDDETAARIVAVDNRSNDLATYDTPELVELLEMLAATDEGLIATGYDGDDLDELLADLESFDPEPEKYTRKVESPIYEPEGPPPLLEDLIDRTQAELLLTEIGAAEDLPPDVRSFLEAAADRHTVFRFDRIANYYAHAPAEVQKLMEASALIIIDFEQAIERGYAKLNDEVHALFEKDYPDA